MKYLIIFLLFISILVASQKEKQLTTPSTTIKLLETIKGNAIVLGSGEKEIHTFIDPLCRMSQRYLALIYKNNNKIFSKYTIYLYLHEIKSKKSKKHILNIMGAESNERMLRAIMLKKEKYNLVDIGDEKNKKTFSKIADIGNKIGVNKRPYIIINGKVK